MEGEQNVPVNEWLRDVNRSPFASIKVGINEWTCRVVCHNAVHRKQSYFFFSPVWMLQRFFVVVSLFVVEAEQLWIWAFKAFFHLKKSYKQVDFCFYKSSATESPVAEGCRYFVGCCHWSAPLVLQFQNTVVNHQMSHIRKMLKMSENIMKNVNIGTFLCHTLIG